MLATTGSCDLLSKTIAPGYQPTGINPSSFESSSSSASNSITPIAFCEPLATYNRSPAALNASALGPAPNSSAGLGLAQIERTTSATGCRSTDRKSSAALAQTT